MSRRPAVPAPLFWTPEALIVRCCAARIELMLRAGIHHACIAENLDGQCCVVPPNSSNHYAVEPRGGFEEKKDRWMVAWEIGVEE